MSRSERGLRAASSSMPMEEERAEEVAADEIEEDDDETDDELEDDGFVVNCQGCRAREDDEKEGTLWVQCGGCATWMHGRCVGRYSLQQCEERDFTCFECQTTEARGGRAARRTTPSTRKPCTPWCPPPGCAGGRGCDKGMGSFLTLEQRELIEDLVMQVAEMENQFHSMTISPKPMERAVYNHPQHGLVECFVASWQFEEGTAAVQYYDDKVLKERAGASLARIVRFAPRWTKRELDAEATRIGCIQFHPPRKQLQFEMRRVRQRYGYRLPMTPAEYITKMKRAGNERGGGCLALGPCVSWGAGGV